MLTKEQWIRKRRRKRYRNIIVLTSLIMLMIFIIFFMVITVLKFTQKNMMGFAQYTLASPDITEMYLTPNDYSRPQTPLVQVNSIVIHYTANPGTGAKSNRNYFENLKDGKTTSASSHFVIGLEGEIIQCIPLDEISFASNDRNFDTISIECCHPDETGQFNDKTYASLVALTAWLCCEYNLEIDDVIRHYDVKGKLCPLYYVVHEDAWDKLKADIETYIKENAIS